VLIYCDESGGVGRGVMTLAAVSIEAEVATHLVSQYRAETGLTSELKGSRIDLDERRFFLKLVQDAGVRATIGLAITALKPAPNQDRGDHDKLVYGALLDDVIGALLPETGGCAQVIFDDGRYDPATLGEIRADVAALLGGMGTARMALSHHLDGLQIADVIANSFFNRALVNDRQPDFIEQLAPFLDSGQFRMRILNPADGDQT
jgi:hypothetical protein